MVVSFCENDNEDPMISTICQSFYLSKSASVIATCAGALFSILPLIVISVIFRSQQRFSSIYHRIIIFISSFDFLTCISSALTTIPMPSSRGSGGDDVVIYPFDSIVGGAHGTVQTCEAQAFIYVFTFYGSGLYFCGLSVFYLCMIRFQMSDTTMRKCVEPIIHVFGCVLPLLMSVTFLSLELLNPTPYEAWCSVGVYPWDCSKIDSISCIRGQKVAEHYVQFVSIFAGAGTLLSVLVVAICMGLIIRGVFLARKMKRKSSNEETIKEIKANDNEKINNVEQVGVDEAHEQTDTMDTSNINGAALKEECQNIPVHEESGESDQEMAGHSWDDEIRSSLVYQALMYIGTFLFIRLVRIFCLFSPSPWLQGFRVLSTSLQAFFNSIIFLYHKVHNLRKLQPALSIRHAFYRIILDPFPTTELELTGLSVVNNDVKINRPETDVKIAIREVGVEDASKDMHLSRISGEEASYMLDINMHIMKRRGTPRTQKAGNAPVHRGSGVSSGRRSANLSSGISRLSYDDAKEEFQDDSGVSFSTSKYDASTVRA